MKLHPVGAKRTDGRTDRRTYMTKLCECAQKCLLEQFYNFWTSREKLCLYRNCSVSWSWQSKHCQ